MTLTAILGSGWWAPWGSLTTRGGHSPPSPPLSRPLLVREQWEQMLERWLLVSH